MRRYGILLLILLFGINSMPGGSARAAKVKPSAFPEPTQTEKKLPGAKMRQPNNFLTGFKSRIFAKLRPVGRDEAINFSEAERILKSKTTTLDKIYGDGFEQRLQGEYASRVRPFEQKANDPLRRARPWEMEQFDSSRRDMADWTAKEALNKQWQDFFRGADKNSAPMQVMSIMRTPDDDKPAAAPDKKGAIAKGQGPTGPAAVAEEPKIPTRLKTNLNPIKTEGQVVLQNPVVTTGVKGSRNEMAFELNREFKALGTHPNAKYGMKAECFQLNLNQKITDRISLNLDHAAYTGAKRGPTGEKTRETAKFTYSVSF